MKSIQLKSVLFIFVVLFSCSKDNENSNPPGVFSFQGQAKNTEKALFIHDDDRYGTKTNFYNHLFIVDNSFTINVPLVNGSPVIEGWGNGFSFSIIGVSAKLDEGTYVYLEGGDENDPFTIYYGALLIKDPRAGFDIVSCTMQVAEDDGKYSITYEGIVKDEQGTTYPIEGHYEGALIEVSKKDAENAQDYVTEYEFLDQSVTGTIDDITWNMITGKAEIHEYYSTIILSDTEVNCGSSDDDGNSVRIRIDENLEIGVYNPVYISFNSLDTDDHIESTYGVVEILSITNEEIHGRIVAEVDESTYVNGNFISAVCD